MHIIIIYRIYFNNRHIVAFICLPSMSYSFNREDEDDNSEEEEEDCVISEVKTPIFNIAFADSSSNARSSPLIKFFFIMLCFCCMILFSVACPCDLSFLFCRLDVIGLIIIDLMIVFIIGTIA